MFVGRWRDAALEAVFSAGAPRTSFDAAQDRAIATTVSVINHLEEPLTGLLREMMDSEIELIEADARGGDPLPRLDDISGIISLGGEDSVTSIESHGYMLEELGLLRGAITRRVPILGLCLGAQILAAALGGQVVRMGRPVIGWRNAMRSSDSKDDPLVGELPRLSRVLQWHEDQFSVPPGGVELFERDGSSPTGFRAGPSAWGLQFHPEADLTMIKSWLSTTRASQLRSADASEADILRSSVAHEAEQRERANLLFAAFSRAVLDSRVSR